MLKPLRTDASFSGCSLRLSGPTLIGANVLTSDGKVCVWWPAVRVRAVEAKRISFSVERYKWKGWGSPQKLILEKMGSSFASVVSLKQYIKGWLCLVVCVWWVSMNDSLC